MSEGNDQKTLSELDWILSHPDILIQLIMAYKEESALRIKAENELGQIRLARGVRDKLINRESNKLESNTYIEQLRDITEFFTDENGNVKRLLTAVDVGHYLHIHRVRAAKLYGITKVGITTVELARKLTSEHK